MAAATVIRFPPPPPTRNELTPEQRAKLIRSNNKLGQVLGSTPHVLDSTYRIPAPKLPEEQSAPRPKTPTSSRNPFRTHGRSKSVPKVDLDALRANSPDSVSSSRSSSSRKSAPGPRPVADDEQAWRSPYPAQRPPLLKLSAPSSSRKPRLETIPGSPPFDQLTSSMDPPSFSIPSDAAVRREKMRRLRRRLGDNVPTELVFPSFPEDSDSESEEDSPLVSTPTSTMSREWLLIHKPLPDEPYPTSEVHRALPDIPIVKQGLRHRLWKEKPKERLSKGAKRLESIAETAAETHGEQVTCVGVTVSAGMQGKGKSRRFVQGDLAMDQIGTVWGGAGMW
ncbi:hypothetical protein BV20DRAFT_1034880 [Pilatotrama ljubarskyi]|nr:hypothetical protein BV20DRAFT_1034880 [Pilatotrama ljubarskyi]